VISQQPGADGTYGQRLATRRKAAQERQNKVLEMLVAGYTNMQMAGALGVASSTISRDVEAVLERRREETNPDLVRAREIHALRLGQLLAAWWPLATGTYEIENERTGEADTLPPDPKAAEVVLKILDRMASGGLPQPETNVTNVGVFVGNVLEKDAAVSKIMTTLAQIADKRDAIEGELANVGTTVGQLTGTEQADDRPPPPPTQGEDQKA